MPGRRAARRENRQQERQTFGRGGSAEHYRMQQKMFSIGQDFFIENESGQKVYKVDGKVLRVRDTLYFKDMQGNVLCKIQQKVARIKDSMEISDANGNRLAMVKKAIITPVRDRWSVKIGDGPDLPLQFASYVPILQTGLEMATHPGSQWVWAGIAVMTLGTLLSFLIRHERLWLRITPTDQGCELAALHSGAPPQDPRLVSDAWQASTTPLVARLVRRWPSEDGTPCRWPGSTPSEGRES